nr:reverse transcriptase domain-containing protein [Tanacetum cinerariifolium]
LNHPFNIDLMPVELGSFDVIIGMDWLRRCHAVIVCNEKLVRIPYGNETLTFHGNESINERESRFTVILCSKAQVYIAKGCQIFLAQISAKKEEDKSERKQLKDVPVIRGYPDVFPKDLSGLPPAQPVEFQIDLIPGAAPGVSLQAEQYDWLEDTDEEVNEQELEAHYSYMAKIQEVPIADSGTDSDPVEQVQNDAGYNVFANKRQHSEQSESVTNTCLVETNDSNVTPDSTDMCEDDIQN